MRTIALAALFAAAVPATAQYAQQAPSPTVWTPTMDQWLQMDLSTRVLTLQDAYVHPPQNPSVPPADRGEKREQDCVQAFGDKAFCECLNRESPAVASFTDYVNVVTHSRKELGTRSSTSL